MDSNFTISDLQDDFFIEKVLMDVQKAFIEMDGYYELYNLGRDNPISKEEFLKLCD